MKLLIDLQSSQSLNRYRGIGRYSISLARAIIKNARNHEIFILLNNFDKTVTDSVLNEFSKYLAPSNIFVFFAPGSVRAKEGCNNSKRKISELLREHMINSILPDAVLITSMFEGWDDDVVTSINILGNNILNCAVVYDLIPLLHKKKYFISQDHIKWYDQKIRYLTACDLFLSISEYSRSECLQHLHIADDAIKNISTAVSNQQFKNGKKTNRAVIADRFNIKKQFLLYCGGLDKRKNLTRTIKAFSFMNKEVRLKFDFVIVGYADPREMNDIIINAHKTGVRKNIKLLGHVSDEDLANLYSMCRLFILPSIHEGFGLPALEAMSCGAAVIGSNATSIPEVIGREDALFDPYSVKSIAKMIEKGLTDEEFNGSLRLHAKQQVKKFSWDLTAKRALHEIEKSIINLSGQKKKCPPSYNELIDKIAAESLGMKNNEILAIAESIVINTERVFGKTNKKFI
jgi:glycosyltransferase involved in cell wall biosynthesis